MIREERESNFSWNVCMASDHSLHMTDSDARITSVKSSMLEACWATWCSSCFLKETERKRGWVNCNWASSLQTRRKDKNQFAYPEQGFHQYQECMMNLSIKQLDWLVDKVNISGGPTQHPMALKYITKGYTSQWNFLKTEINYKKMDWRRNRLNSTRRKGVAQEQ